MKNTRKATPKRLGSYLTAAVGVGTLAGTADAAITVTFYPHVPDDVSVPVGLNVGGWYAQPAFYGFANSKDAVANFGTWGTEAGPGTPLRKAFTPGTDIAIIGFTFYAAYQDNLSRPAGTFVGGAQLGDQNYASIKFNPMDGGVLNSNGQYDSVGQFHFDGAGGGYLVALARNDDNSALSISAGKAAIDAISSVPEPASVLGTMGLLASGLMIRRRNAAKWRREE